MNLRTQLQRIIAKAGLTEWPKLFQNLRSTCETELAETFSLHVVTAWLGKSQLVAAKHYLQVTDEHFATATQNPTETADKCGKGVVRPLRENEKTPVFPGSSAADSSFRNLRIQSVPPQGAELSQGTPGKIQVVVHDDALSDARLGDRRLIELVEAWAGLPEDVKDRIEELVAAVREGVGS